MREATPEQYYQTILNEFSRLMTELTKLNARVAALERSREKEKRTAARRKRKSSSSSS